MIYFIMKQIAIILSIFFVLCSCKSKEIATHNDFRSEYIRTFTPIVLPVDSAYATAVLECTKEGAVLLSRLNIETSKNARMSLMIDSLNNLTVSAVVERDTLYLPSDSVIITRDVLRTEIAYKDKELTRWQKIKQEAGGIAIGGCIALILSFIGYLFFKKWFGGK